MKTADKMDISMITNGSVMNKTSLHVETFEGIALMASGKMCMISYKQIDTCNRLILKYVELVDNIPMVSETCAVLLSWEKIDDFDGIINLYNDISENNSIVEYYQF